MQYRKSAWAVAEVQVSYKPTKTPITITSSTDAYQAFCQIWDKQLLTIQEQFYALFLNAANQAVCWRLIATGTGNQCVVDNKLIIAIACKTLAQKVLIAHNHPSGSLTPSMADKVFTINIQNTLQMLDVTLEDHLILGHGNYLSFKEHNIL